MTNPWTQPSAVADQVIDIREIVSRTDKAYWYTYGMPPLRSGVCLPRRDVDVAVGDTQILCHCRKRLRMRCVETTTDTTTWVEDWNQP